MIAIGEELRQRGFDVVISISQPYASIAERSGLQTEVIISEAQFHEMVGDPAVWKTVRGVRRVLRAMADHFVVPHHDVIRKHYRAGETVLVSHPLDFASRVVREADENAKLAAVHLQPVLLRTPDDPPRLTPWPIEPTGPPWLIRAGYYLADHLGLDPVIRPPVNRLRAQYDLPPIRRVLDQWWLSPDRVIGMYPQWFAPATDLFQPRLVHAGFPLADHDDAPFDPPKDRPIVFTMGTAHYHSRQFFQRAAKACQSLDHPGILLSSHSENFPAQLPAQVRTCPYVSLQKLLPHCAAIVHHGGIGTTSQALAAGVPQIIRPMAFDQFDNARRVENLRCGHWLRRDAKLGNMLSHVLANATMTDTCSLIASKLKEPAGAKIAADQIVALL
ncbi:MurG-like transferase [Planctomycetes bacterium K23_9]|uniref:MurG-like transferase n=2 Tax=Stieleria marina TaxID=1930275 RepID=A0A517NPK8_9BACT|nr:MurG-like transferase [Planctomycetes bacterium K23_9]